MKTFVSWIPTNTGNLSLNLKGNPKDFICKNYSSIPQIDNNNKGYKTRVTQIKNLSDTNLPNENYPDITFEVYENKNLDIFYGHIYLFIEENLTTHTFIGKFTLEKNGLIFINIDEKDTIFSKLGVNIKETAQVFYTIIKSFKHWHNHHEQKVDTIINVYEEKDFSHTKILNNMISYIKRQEVLLKTRKEFYKRLQAPIAEEICNNTQGVKSYIEAFVNIFEYQTTLKDKALDKSIYNNLDPLIDSIKNLTEVVTHHKVHVIQFLKITLSFFGIFISILALLKPSKIEYSFSYFNMFPFAFIFVFSIYFLNYHSYFNYIFFNNKKIQDFFKNLNSFIFFRFKIPITLYRAITFIAIIWMIIPILLISFFYSNVEIIEQIFKVFFFIYQVFI